MKMFKMTIREALKIQAQQLDYYAPNYPQLREVAAQATHVAGLDHDALRPVVEINRLVPRGGFLGQLIGVEF